MQQQQDNERPLYATLRYDVLKKLKITPIQYMVLDMVYHLSAKDGYCYKSVASMAYDLDITRRGMQKILAKLIEREILVRVDKGFVCSKSYTNTAYLVRTSSANKVPKRPKPSANKVHGGCEQSSTKCEQSTTKNYIEQHVEKNSDKSELATPVIYGKPEINELFEYWATTTGIPIQSRVKPNRQACSVLYRKHGTTKLRQLIDGVGLSLNDQYAPRISDFCDLQAKLTQLLIWGRRRNQTPVKGMVHAV